LFVTKKVVGVFVYVFVHPSSIPLFLYIITGNVGKSGHCQFPHLCIFKVRSTPLISRGKTPSSGWLYLVNSSLQSLSFTSVIIGPAKLAKAGLANFTESSVVWHNFLNHTWVGWHVEKTNGNLRETSSSTKFHWLISFYTWRELNIGIWPFTRINFSSTKI
jgi:hypothetical protein